MIPLSTRTRRRTLLRRSNGWLWATFFSLLLATPTAQVAGAELRSVEQKGEQREVELRLPGEKRSVWVQIRRPKLRTKGEKFPVVLVFGGFENAARVLDLFTVQKRWVLASFDYPFRGRRPLRFPESVFDVREARRMVRLTPIAMRELVRRVSELEPSVDSARRILVGASLGGPFAVQAASQLSSGELGALVLVHSFGDVRVAATASLKALCQRAFPAFPAVASLLGRIFGQGVWKILGSPDPVRDAHHLPEGLRVYFLRAGEDSRIPALAVDRLEEALRQAPIRLDVERQAGDHLRPGDRAQLQEALKAVDAWLSRQRLIGS
jgi:dienelactone hydrolase